MALIASPYGLRPVKRVDGMAYAGATTQYAINPAGLATNLFYGQVVHVAANGFLALSTATGADGTTNAFPAGSTLTGSQGVFMGCEYISAQGQRIFSQMYPTGYVAPTGTQILAYVVDDPNVLFQVQLNGAIAQTNFGSNTFFPAAQSTSTGNVAFGVSTSALTASTVTTTAAFRLMGTLSPFTDGFPDVLVKFNPGYHSMTNAVGL